MPDPAFAEPRLAAIYDDLDGERDDLDVYVGLVTEFAARSVIDVGCGTGSLASRLAAMGIDVVGVDPAAASLEVARRKPYADRIRWIHGDARSLGDHSADLIVMTGNVAQVFLTDDAWHTTLAALRAASSDDAVLVFETRDPAARAWRRWTRDDTHRVLDTAHGRV
ncbi:MAG: class I SAM-dependent methyltransferase, partial [Actinomycetota bacterium]